MGRLPLFIFSCLPVTFISFVQLFLPIWNRNISKVTTAICPIHESWGIVYSIAVFHQPLHLCALIWSGVWWMHIWELSRVELSWVELSQCEWIPPRDELWTRMMLSLGNVIFTQNVVQNRSKPHRRWIAVAKSNILMGASILFYKHRTDRALV